MDHVFYGMCLIIQMSTHFDKDILSLFKHTLTSTYFCFKGEYYEQTDGVAIGSPLSPVIAIFYIEDFESRATEQALFKPTSWYKYVNDAFMIWPHDQDKLQGSLDHLNTLQERIEFTT